MSMLDCIEKYTRILKQNEYSDQLVISDININKSEELVGEHFASICEFVKITLENNNKAENTLDLFLKRPVKCTEIVQQVVFDDMFLRESNFFGNLLKSMLEYCKSRNASSINLDKYFPKCFYSDGSEIIMENLVERGFKMSDKKDRQDIVQASLVIKGLAKLHGVSFAMIQNTDGGAKTMLQNNPLLSDFFLKPEVSEVFGPMFQQPPKIIMQILEECNNLEKRDETLKFFKNINSDYYEATIEPLRSSNLYDVLLHGDCWNNNMMFRTIDSNLEVVLVDLQCSRLGSPSCDLVYYIFTSLRPEVRKQWKQLIQIYFQTFLETLSTLGEIFTYSFEEFKKEFAQKSMFGLMMGILQLVGIEAMSTTDIEKSKGFDPEEFNENIKTFIQNNPDRAIELGAEVISLVNDYKSILIDVNLN